MTAEILSYPEVAKFRRCDGVVWWGLGLAFASLVPLGMSVAANQVPLALLSSAMGVIAMVRMGIAMQRSYYLSQAVLERSKLEFGEIYDGLDFIQRPIANTWLH